jgi:uncharacterized tellurite resistance protein B-like protein
LCERSFIVGFLVVGSAYIHAEDDVQVVVYPLVNGFMTGDVDTHALEVDAFRQICANDLIYPYPSGYIL